VIADQAEAKRDAAFGCIADSGSDARIRYGDNQVCIDRRFARQLSSHLFAASLNRAAKYTAVGTREIDVFENAARLWSGGSNKNAN